MGDLPIARGAPRVPCEGSTARAATVVKNEIVSPPASRSRPHSSDPVFNRRGVVEAAGVEPVLGGLANLLMARDFRCNGSAIRCLPPDFWSPGGRALPRTSRNCLVAAVNPKPPAGAWVLIDNEIDN